MAKHGRGSPFSGAGLLFEPGMRQRLLLAWRLLRDPRVAPRLKLVAPVIAVVYLLSPIDLVPDFLLGLGQLDDVGVLALAVMIVTRLLPHLADPAVLREHLGAMDRRGADRDGSGRAGDGERVVDAAYTVRR